MLFEKTLRKKKVPPYYMELIMGTIYLSLLINGWFILGALIKGSLWYIPKIVIIGFLVVIVIVSAIAVLVGCLPVDATVFPLIKDKKKKRIITQDNIVMMCDNDPINIPVPGTPGWNTVLCFNYMEPFLQIVDFTVYPLGLSKAPPMPIKLFIPTVYFTYHKQKDYKEIKAEWMKTKAEAKAYDDQNTENYLELIKVKEVGLVTFYLTYTKMKEFNKLFELVNPPEFRITTYEKSNVLIALEPIPGKEYPTEALTCMEKINAMYP